MLALPQRFAVLLVAAALFTACAGGAGRGEARAQSRYSHMLHNTFYEAWRQPALVRAPRGKVSVPVDVEIDARGRVRQFAIAKSSGYGAIDNSIRAVQRRVRKVAPPPLASPDGIFRLRIFFELDVKRG